MIESFKDEESRKVFGGVHSRRLPFEIQRPGRVKLVVLNESATLAELAEVNGHNFEKLKGDREGQYSIRINRQWRICFNWTEENNSANVEIVDYH